MKIEEIKELIEYINQLNLEEVNIETETLKLQIKKHGSRSVSTTGMLHHPFTWAEGNNQMPTTMPGALISHTVTAEVPNTQVEIKSPMIGTFYRASSPDNPPFVSIGDEIKTGKAICIIEAMKLFNEIEAEVSGKIIKILVDDASPVEYDQPLFIIEPC